MNTPANPAFPITVYGLPDDVCFGCKQTKKKFDAAGVLYDFIDLSLDANQNHRQALKSLGIMSAPHVITPAGEWTGLNVGKVNDTIAAYAAAVEAAA